MSSEGLVLYTTLSSMHKTAKILMFTAESSKTQFFFPSCVLCSTYCRKQSCRTKVHKHKTNRLWAACTVKQRKRETLHQSNIA